MNIPIADFCQRTGLSPESVADRKIQAVVSLRQMVKTTQIALMSNEYIKALLYNVPLANQVGRPYSNLVLRNERVDPRSLHVGQRFVQRKKLLDQMENASAVFKGFPVYSGPKCHAMIVFGEDVNGTLVMAHYMPPIIEVSQDKYCLLDGVHRNVRYLGTTIESIIIEKVVVPFPCDPVGKIGEMNFVDEKPAREERYTNLQPDLFRNLDWVGIDG